MLTNEELQKIEAINAEVYAGGYVTGNDVMGLIATVLRLDKEVRWMGKCGGRCQRRPTMKQWDELTEAEVDALEGVDLSEAVADAMGRCIYHWAGKVWLGTDTANRFCNWQPHSDANQALEVWQALIAANSKIEFGMSGDGAWVMFPDKWGEGGTIIASGTLCEAICRAYLKVRLADDADE